MKYLSHYKLFEAAGKLLPSNFVKLHSIDHALDPQTGWIYPLYRGGIYYEDDNGLSIEWGDVSFDGISDKDMKFVDGLWKSVEPIMKDKINFNILDELKDLSLEFIDEGFTLYYAIYLGKIGDENPLRVAYGGFNHQVNHFNYNRKFPQNFKLVMDKRDEDLLYSFRLASYNHVVIHDTVYTGFDASIEILPILKNLTGYDNIEVIE